MWTKAASWVITIYVKSGLNIEKTNKTHPRPLPAREGSSYSQVSLLQQNILLPSLAGRGRGWVSFLFLNIADGVDKIVVVSRQ